MLKSLFWFLFILLLCLNVTAQIRYTGKIQDLVTKQGVGSALVELGDTQVKTNRYGDFIITSECESELSTPQLQIFNNSLIWYGENTTSLSIHTLDGRMLVKEELHGENTTYLLPQLPVGLYILRMHTNGTPAHFKLLSDGFQTSVASKNAPWLAYSACEGFDTIRISREGYMPRLVPVARHHANLDIKLLATSYADLDYFSELIDPVAFDLIASAPARSNSGGVRAIKIIYDIKKDRMYYINGNKYELHYTFASKVLGFNEGHQLFNLTQYTDNPNRKYYMVDINYFGTQDRYVMQFVAAVGMSCDQIQFLYDRILKSSFFGEKFYFFSVKPEWDSCSGLQTISSEQLYEGQNYQALHLSKNFGYLTKVSLSDLSETYLSRRDILLLDGIPNDVSVVAGIITTEFQTPLSHINVLSNSRNTPNMALRDGWTNPKLDSLLGKLVYLEVGSNDFIIREANLEEAQAHWSLTEPSKPIVLTKNVSVTGLVDLDEANYRWVDRIGGKAANFAEMKNVKMPDGSQIPLPEEHFAIPFYYYEQHLIRNGLDTVIEKMLKNQDFIENPEVRKTQLAQLQHQIRTAPFDPELQQLIIRRIGNFNQFEAIRFRSSTNAEDLEGFSGAGLYDSYSAKKNDPDKTVSNAVRKVWASLWNWRAFEERSYFKIDHLSCAMGLLVHRSFPNEDANGVLVTENLYNENPGFIINAQFEEYSIVFPEPGIIHDQIMLFTWSVVPGEQFMVEYLTYSNLPGYENQHVLTNEEINALGAYSLAIKRRFYYDLPHECNCVFKDFGVDIEFKIDSDVSPRKLYIKQARLYK